MQISKSCLSIVSATLIQGSVFSAPDIEGTLVQKNENEDLIINPIFQPEIINQLHYLIKRSYRITDRQNNPYNYLHAEQLTHRRSTSFRRLPISQPSVSRRRADSAKSAPKPEIHWDRWIMHEPFTGIHGTEDLPGLIGAVPQIPYAVELDYPGFVAYLPREAERPPLIAVVFRGSQSKSFQPLGGILGPSWLTNFSAAKGTFPEGIIGSEGLAGATFHEGYLRKYLSSRINILAHIEDMLLKIPEADRTNARIIFTGHSQGAGVALPAALDGTYVLGKRHFGDDFDNKVTPRFFVYALSGPNSTGDSATKALMNTVIGRDNIIRHNSLFDIVTYACPGKRFDSEFCRAVFGTLAGVATGYHPVGHLAIDDMKSLIVRGFRHNNKEISNEALEEILYELSKGYTRAIQRRQLGDSVLKHIRSFYLSVSECRHLLKGAHEMDGLYFFACINHYGSSTANIFCTPHSAAAATPVKTSHESSFDPRLPETNLNSCLWRGQRNRELIFNEVAFVGPEQVFSSELPAHQEITYDSGYRSDSEGSEES